MIRRLISGTLLLGLATPVMAQEAEAPPVVAVVLGEDVPAPPQPGMLTGMIFGPLLQDYAKSRGIEATDEQIDQFIARSDRGSAEMLEQFEARLVEMRTELEKPDLGADERAALEADVSRTEENVEGIRRQMAEGLTDAEEAERRQMAARFVELFEVKRSLYEEYGGRVIFQQAGPEPLDAYRQFLESREAAGDFEILDESYEAPFWRYFRDDSMHRFFPEDEADRVMSTPWWLMEEPGD